MDQADIWALFLHFMLLSAIAMGGITSVLPDMQRYVVEVNPWMTAKQFADVFTLSMVAPAPNVMFVTVIGWLLGGWVGAIALTLALFIPSTLTTLAVMRLVARNPDGPLGRAIRGGLAPVTIGFVLASGWVLAKSVNHDLPGYLLTALTVVVLLRTKMNPLWLIAAGALAGIAGVTQ